MNKLFSKQKKLYYFNSNDGYAAYEFGETLDRLICRMREDNQTIVVLCIGSDRATGDCLGPIVGYKLKQYDNDDFAVYGTLEKPVHAKNLDETIRSIYETYDNPLVIAVDASLGQSKHVGYITLGEGSIRPGAGVNKNLPIVGDIFITGIVNFSGHLDHMLLQTTRLNIVMHLADFISFGMRQFLSNDYRFDNVNL